MTSDTPAEGTGPVGQTFWEHLAELRSRLITIAAAILIGFFLGWGFREEIFALLTAPVREGLAVHGIHRLTAIEAAEAMMVYLKLSLAAAIVLVVPVALYQLWAFVRPGLLEREIRPMRRVMVLAFFMFALGVLFCYRLVLPLVMEFLAAFTLGSGGVEFQVTMNSAYSTALALLVGFGLVFELPLVMVLLATTPLVDWRKYLKWIRYAVVLAFVVGAVFTPPDVLSQLLMAVPLCLLYGVGIFLSYLMEKRRLRGGEAARGLDWGLAGMVAVLGGLVALLVLPRSLPAVSFLPYGAERVQWTATGAFPECGGLDRDVAEALPEVPPPASEGADGERDNSPAVEWVCAQYAEGNLLVGRSDEDWGGETCARFGETGSTEQATACAVDGGLVVTGQHLLVARYMHNRKMRLVDSDPVLPPDTATESLWLSLRRTEGRQPPFVRISRVESEPARIRMDLSFPDAERAREFAASFEEGKELSVVAGHAKKEADPRLRQVLVELTAAVESLERQVATLQPQAPPPAGSTSSGPSTPSERLVRVRALLDALEDGAEIAHADPGAPGHRVEDCGGPACAYSILSGRLPVPEEVAASGRLVTAWYPADAVDGRLTALLGP